MLQETFWTKVGKEVSLKIDRVLTYKLEKLSYDAKYKITTLITFFLFFKFSTLCGGEKH